MKMAILELEYKNIRKITALKLPFTKADGSVISNNFIMMANGTGKTTTMELIKGLFDGTAAGWTASKVRSFAPTLTEADTGEFSITVKFDTLLSEDGIKTLNAYALKGYRLSTDYPLFDKPTSREEFLDAFNVAMQFYEKKDS